MDRTAGDELLGAGKFLRLVRRDGWEFIQRTRPTRTAYIAALTAEGRFVFTREYRIPVGKFVIGCPAGLVGDLDGLESEPFEVATRRELLEETGYEAQRLTVLTEGLTSPGQTDEIATVVLAEGLRKVGPGGGVDGEVIQVKEVPLPEVDSWLEAQARAGCLIDPKVYTALYFIRRQP